jgi:hypothetical protein
MEVIAVSGVRNWLDSRSAVDCLECTDWEGMAPVPLMGVRRRIPPEPGAEVSHGHSRPTATGEESKVDLTGVQ